MTQPLALVLYEKLLPGSQLVNRLQDLKYRVQTLTDPNLLIDCAEQAKPMVVLVALDSTHKDIYSAISGLRHHSSTTHLPVIAFTADGSEETRVRAESAGATLFVSDAAILNHLPECLERALRVE